MEIWSRNSTIFILEIKGRILGHVDINMSNRLMAKKVLITVQIVEMVWSLVLDRTIIIKMVICISNKNRIS